jgi:hypothetical protein
VFFLLMLYNFNIEHTKKDKNQSKEKKNQQRHASFLFYCDFQ